MPDDGKIAIFRTLFWIKPRLQKKPYTCVRLKTRLRYNLQVFT